MRYARWWTALASMALAATLAGETSIGVRITGLPALPAGMGSVRLVDLPRLVASGARPADAPGWLVVGKTAEPGAPRVTDEKPLPGHPVPPTWQQGNFVASF